MLGRSLLFLLAAWCVLLAPIASGQRSAGVAPSQRAAVRGLGERNPGIGPARREGGTIRRFPRSSLPTSRFSQMVRAAGAIFTGTVIGIQRHPARNGQSVETVSVTFHVESAIRGATPGRSFTLSEWIGLWSSGQRYRVGERVFVFLYPPSRLGLTSAVAGATGRFALDTHGNVLLSAQHTAAFRTHPVLGGRSRLRFSDFALAVKQASEEE